MDKLDGVTRCDIILLGNRTQYSPVDVTLSFQDDNRTLKVFIDSKPPSEEDKKQMEKIIDETRTKLIEKITNKTLNEIKIQLNLGETKKHSEEHRTVGERLIDSAKEALAFAQGKINNLIVNRK